VNDRVFIVGGGPSLREFNFGCLNTEDVIVTNVAIFDVPKAKFFITIDYSFILKITNRLQEFDQSDVTKVFVAGLHHENLVEKRGQIRDTRYNLVYDLSRFDIILKSYNETGCGRTWNDFRSGLNSGFCAFQLAVLLGYKKIYLLGMDLLGTKKDTHYHNQYVGNTDFHNKLYVYDTMFRHGIEETDATVISCCSTSSLNNVISFQPILEIL